MAFDAAKIELLEHTYRQVTEHEAAFIAAFYQEFFKIAPDARPLFSQTDMAMQDLKLRLAIELIIDALRSPEELSRYLQGLVHRHKDLYGVRQRFYGTFGSALIKTLENNLGEDWTPEVKAAWEEAFDYIRRTIEQLYR